MTHAVLYVALPDTQAVIHVHSASLWHSFSHRLPTTADDIPYGTPAMCRAVADLATSAKDGVIVMRGHEDGIIAFGSTADEAGNRILALLGNRRPTI
jgi:ribulose-5-phosphate 4-epimerase/fuculose-1-phosphate aldolase